MSLAVPVPGRIAASAIGLALMFVATAVLAEPIRNGFDLAGALVPAEEILQGGPPKDGIPAIDKPEFVAAGKARGLRGKDMVLGIARNGIAKAYPILILNWHEVVNDRFGAEPIVVTFCPLCGSGVAFEATAGGRALQFGVSGLLYNSDVLLYDRATSSLWSQIRAQAVTGPLKGARLVQVPMLHMTWDDWRRRHPQTLVLSERTGFGRDYSRDPYDGYDKTEALMFPARFRAEGFHPKERVLGVLVGGKAKAYPFSELARAAGPVSDIVGGQRVIVRFLPQGPAAEAQDASGRTLATTTLFWFAWAAFHPGTEIFRAQKPTPR